VLYQWIFNAFFIVVMLWLNIMKNMKKATMLVIVVAMLFAAGAVNPSFAEASHGGLFHGGSLFNNGGGFGFGGNSDLGHLFVLSSLFGHGGGLFNHRGGGHGGFNQGFGHGGGLFNRHGGLGNLFIYSALFNRGF